MSNFKLGQVVITEGINDNIAKNKKFETEIGQILERYISQDWGDICAEDRESSDRAVLSGNERIFASYATSLGKVFIITEYNHSVTTILFPHEY